MSATALPFLDRAFDLVVVAFVLGGMIHGAWAGLFRSTVAALMTVIAVFAPLTLLDSLAWWLAHMDTPAWIAPILAFLLLLAATAASIRWITTTMIPEPAMRLPPVIDLLGGSFLGVVTGAVTAGATLIAISMLHISTLLWTDPSGMHFDAGAVMLAVFARCAAAEPEACSTLLSGERLVADRPPAQPGHEHIGAAGRCIASEPFVDRDANGRHDDEEEYLDVDGNRDFSPRLQFHDANANGRRDIGLLERYRLGCWHRVVVLPDAALDAGGGRPLAEEGGGTAEP